MGKPLIIEPPFGCGPLVVERVTAKNGPTILQVPFVRLRLADGVEIHLTERQAVDYGRQLLAACRDPAPEPLPAIYPPCSPKRAGKKETEPGRA